MSLKAQAIELLEEVRSGGRLDRANVVTVLSAIIPAISETAPDVTTVVDDPKFYPKENTPVRFPAKNWGQFSPCKRCGKHEVPDGDMIVRIKGTGWFHDRCWAVLNPDYYKGLELPK
jgi:hypothetical protein